jgi:hypothetical protein
MVMTLRIGRVTFDNWILTVLANFFVQIYGLYVDLLFKLGWLIRDPTKASGTL